MFWLSRLCLLFSFVMCKRKKKKKQLIFRTCFFLTLGWTNCRYNPHPPNLMSFCFWFHYLIIITWVSRKFCNISSISASVYKAELMYVLIDGDLWRIKFCWQYTILLVLGCCSTISSTASSSTTEGLQIFFCLGDWCYLSWNVWTNFVAHVLWQFLGFLHNSFFFWWGTLALNPFFFNR